jgi:soluble lytic murein transglycosylase-like protein
VKRFGVTISETTERRWRATSFGLMQVMGQVARERGFTGEWLTELTNPEVGIEYGCRELKRRLDLAHGDVHSGLLGYNGGGDPAYPSKVLKHYNDYL